MKILFLNEIIDIRVCFILEKAGDKMSNVIAVIWDCDKTLIDGYMQDPIFRTFNIDASEFWAEVNEMPKKLEEKGIRVNHDTYYLNHFISYINNGKMAGLNNEMLRNFGKEQKLYPGILELFEKLKGMFRDDASYTEYGIKVENYIVSTGFAEVVRGTALMEFVEEIWGCELIEKPNKDGENVINEIVYTIDNTTKTRAIFEINKGIGKLTNIDVNSKIPNESRRVQFKNMIYIADGPSDIPAFSVIKQKGGSTFAIYPKGEMKAMRQVEQMRKDGRVDMYAEADYSKDTTAYMWIINKVQELADNIKEIEKKKILSSASCSPHHIV